MSLPMNNVHNGVNDGRNLPSQSQGGAAPDQANAVSLALLSALLQQQQQQQQPPQASFPSGAAAHQAFTNSFPPPQAPIPSSSQAHGSLSVSAAAPSGPRAQKSSSSKDVAQSSSAPGSSAGQGTSSYRDYSQVPNAIDSDGVVIGKSSSLAAVSSDSSKKFPAKLYEILSREEFSDYISWAPHGRSWRIVKPKAFEKHVLPEYFRHGKYNSFMRQVNGWGFRRITQGPDFNSYYHEYFLRGMPHLFSRMRRASVSMCNDGQSHYDPDFRLMPSLPGGPSAACGPTAMSVPSSNGVKQEEASAGVVSEDDDVSIPRGSSHPIPTAQAAAAPMPAAAVLGGLNPMMLQLLSSLNANGNNNTAPAPAGNNSGNLAMSAPPTMSNNAGGDAPKPAALNNAGAMGFGLNLNNFVGNAPSLPASGMRVASGNTSNAFAPMPNPPIQQNVSAPLVAEYLKLLQQQQQQQQPASYN